MDHGHLLQVICDDEDAGFGDIDDIVFEEGDVEALEDFDFPPTLDASFQYLSAFTQELWMKDTGQEPESMAAPLQKLMDKLKYVLCIGFHEGHDLNY